MVEKLKYLKDRSVAETMVQLWPLIPDTESLYVPVPIHFFRRMERGFNQSEVLLNLLAKKYNLKTNFQLLKRIKHTPKQAHFSKIERQGNILNAFKIKASAIPKKVILVDDVVTTGSTLDEMAKILKQAGVNEVHAVTFARAEKTTP